AAQGPANERPRRVKLRAALATAQSTSGRFGLRRDTAPVFERFDAQARLVVVLAQEEARSLQHPVIDVEHILLALSRVDARLVGASPDVLRRRVTELRGVGEKPSPAQMPLADEARRSLEFAHEEAVF